MNFDNFFRDNFSQKDYEEYMVKWLNGLKDEIAFWNSYFDEKGLQWKESYQEMTVYERDFTLDRFLTEGSNTILLDVGAGPLSACGSRTKKANLEFHAVDPLAHVYKKIKQKYNIRTKIQPEFGMVEKLNEKYPENMFDIVHMNNALDHSFNPVMGLMQMLYVCKIGGKIILFHRDNEAAHEKYAGLHQWNLQVLKGSYFIWRGKKRFDVSKLFGDIITIETRPAESREDFHMVVLTKKTQMELVEDPLLEIYHRRVFDKLLECLFEDFCKKRTKKEIGWLRGKFGN